ncbi:MAG: PAS domain-containing protein, partial [Verrucomicrobia bacterium]|nr:PAS domain-containing protein [Verrucomicrobiota bacterium]
MKTSETHAMRREPGARGNARRSPEASSSRRVIWVVLLISLTASAGGWLISLRHARLGDQMRFEEEVAGARVMLDERLAAYENFLHGAGGLFAASASVERQEWRAYVLSVAGDSRFPGLDALGYVERVARGEVNSFEAAARADGRPGFKVNAAAGIEGDLLVIKYLEPEEGRQALLGQCINNDPARMAAAEAARDSGRAVVSGQVRLSDDAMGFLMMLPIYESGAVPAGGSDRRRLFKGLVYARFGLDQVLDEVFQRSEAGLRIRIFDGFQDSPEALIYDSGGSGAGTDAYVPAFTERALLPMGGRSWRLDFSSSPAFDARTSRMFSTLAGIGGLVVSLLLFGIVWSLSRTREHAMVMAEEMTAALRGANQQLKKEIADRERAQQSTKDSEAQYHSLVENLPLSILRKDPQGRFTFANQRFCHELGKSLEEILGKTEFDLFPAEQAARHKQEEDRILESGAALEEVQELRLSDADLRFVQVIKTPLRDSLGEVTGLQGIFWDVTDKHRTEMELKRERELLHTLLDNVPDRIYFKDEESRFLRVNRAMAELFNLGDPSEVIGRSDFDFFGEEHARQAYDDERRIIRTGRPVIGLVEREDMPDGTHRWASTTKMPMRNQQGRVIGTFGISRDVTQMKEAEAEMRRTNEQLERAVADLERAQLSMKDSEALYHSLVESLPLSLYRKDLEGRFTFANHRFANELGKPVEDILGRTEFDVFPSAQASQHQAEEARIIESGTSLEETQELHLPGSDVRYAQVIKAPLRDGSGTIIGVQGLFWDVTDKHRAEQALQAERDLLHTLMNNLPDRIYFKDRQSRYLRNSRAHLERLGLSDAREAVGKSDFDFFPEEHARRAYEDEQRLMRTGETVVKEEKITGPDGTIAWALSTKLPLRDKQGNTVGTFGISHDITGMKVVEEKLQRERDLLYALLDNIPDRIYFKDRQSRIMRMSRAHADLFGLKDPREAEGKTDFDYFTEEHARQAFEDEQRIIRTGEPVIGLVEKETLPGNVIRWASTTKMPLRNKGGEIVGTFGITRDITDLKQTSEALKRAKEAAEEANRTKSQFLANMSHELRTPLNSIIGFSNIMLKNKAGNLTASELSFLGRILSNGKHLLDLINQILDLSKIEARKVELQVSSVRVDELVRETVAQQEGLVRERPVVLRCDMPERVAPIQTDPDKLRQILINLIGNSLKFTEKGSVTLRVVTDVRDHHPVRIDVVDTGIGIPGEQLA